MCQSQKQQHPPGARSRAVWVVVPAFDEQDRLGPTLAALTAHYPHVVVVDDGSRDGTAQAAQRYPVRLLRHAINCGQGAALQTGIEYALSRGAEVIVTFDADGQHAVDDIAPLVAPVEAGEVQVTLGSRFRGQTVGMPLSRHLVLWLGVWFTRLCSGLRVSDTHNGLRAFSREAAARLRITQNRMAHASEILDQVRRHGLSYSEVPVTVRYSPATLRRGQTSWSALRIASQYLLGRLIR